MQNHTMFRPRQNQPNEKQNLAELTPEEVKNFADTVRQWRGGKQLAPTTSKSGNKPKSP